MNVTAVTLFVLFVALSLGITTWAARRSKSRSQFYAAASSLSGFQNGVAFTGEFLSAATFLGITGIYFTFGYDGLIYAIGAAMGWPVLLFLLADRLRAMGKYTLTDVLADKLKAPSIRIFAAVATVITLILYLVAQMVGAGLLIELLFDVDYLVSVVVIGLLMLIYVLFGGMVATSWVQIVKACFLWVLGLALAIAVLIKFDFSIGKLYAAAVAAHPRGEKLLEPVGFPTVGASLSAALTQAVGIAGLPHFIMRFFTVPNVAEARKSAAYATGLIGAFYIVMVIIGFGAIAILANNPEYTTGPALLKNGNNMAPLYLAQALGGDVFLGITAAAVFATILAVVAGLTLAVAASMSHDVFATVIRKGKVTEAEELKVSRWSAIAFGAAAIALSVVFRNENITFLVVTALSIAASSTFPLLFLACFWKPLNSTGALVGGTVGLLTAVAGIILGPTVWVAIFGYPQPIFPYQYPTIVGLPVGLGVTMIVSLMTAKK